jgi:NADH-quinone oxidoreductase subunit L
VDSHATETLLRWIVLVPLIGAAINGILNRRIPKQVAGLLACGSVGASLVMSVVVFLRMTGMSPEHRMVTDSMATWMGFGNFQVDLAFAMDPLSAVMALVVTGVGFLIHIYSLGYMAHDDGFQRFFTYLNLFIFAMMTLVLGENLLMLFVGWEGVGLCSYLLISFWFNDEANAAAGKKAFVVNRIGDFGFLIGMFLIGATLLPHLHDGEGVFSFTTMQHHAGILAPLATAICLLLFVGATGKSAQIPLYIWLPDAMAGPTPVSALIHAATMVTAGVYMVARMNFLFVLSPTAMTVVAVVGTITAIFASSIALVQNDIKKVLAYSTVSQLGYMMLACGVGAFAAGIFHVMTHAFFKALLFLGSGSVIHAMSDEQDMRVMGGLGKKLPITSKTFYVGTIAIAGVFPLAGFFSKDEILWKAWSSGHQVLWLLGFIAAGMTAFYMARLVVMTFFGENRATAEVKSHIHESPLTMTMPLVVLAVLSIVGGWIGIPHFMGGVNHFETWLEPVFAGHAAHGAAGHAVGHAADTTMEWILAGCSLALGILGLVVGYVVYMKKLSVAETFRNLGGGFMHRVLLNKYYVDELYEAVFLRPGFRLSKDILWKGVDSGFIDGIIVTGSALVVYLTGSILRIFQNGMVRFYAWSFTIGAAAFFLYISFSG